MFTTLTDAFTSASSEKGTLVSADVARAIRLIVVAMVGAGLVQLGKQLTGIHLDDPTQDFVVKSVAAGAIELARRYFSSN